MVVIGIIAHFLLQQTIPAIIGQFVDGLANSFGGTALFYLGLSMVGQLGKLTRSTVVTLILLITAKLWVQQHLSVIIMMSFITVTLFWRECLIVKLVLYVMFWGCRFQKTLHRHSPFCSTFRLLMPLLCKDMVDVLDTNRSPSNDSSLSNYAFLYGVFPTAPSVGIYAVYYNAEIEVVSLPPPSNLTFSFVTLWLLISFSLCFVSGHRRDGDLHFPLSSDNVCFCLVTHNLLERPSGCDDCSAERQPWH